MKTALHTWSLREKTENNAIDYSPFEILDDIAEMGFKGAEMIAGHVEWGPGDVQSNDMDHLRKIVAHAESRNVDITAFFVFNDFANIGKPEARRADIEFVKGWLHRSAELGRTRLSMLSGNSQPDVDLKASWKSIREAFQELVPVAEECGVTMTIENFGGVIQLADDMVKFFNEIGSPRLRANLDTAFWVKEDEFFVDTPTSEQTEILYSNAQTLAPFTDNVHVKVKGVKEDGTLVGYDDDLGRLLGILDGVGFDGPLVFESIADNNIAATAAKARPIIDAAIDRIASK